MKILLGVLGVCSLTCVLGFAAFLVAARKGFTVNGLEVKLVRRGEVADSDHVDEN